MEGEFVMEPVRQQKSDRVEHGLVTAAHAVLVAVFGLTPLFFIPSPVVSIDYAKSFLVIGGLLLALVLFSLATLRSGKISLSVPTLALVFWGIAASAVVSALLSGDRFDAFFGNTLEVHTAGFVALMAGVISIPLLLNFSKAMIMRVYIVLGASTLVLGLYHVARLVFGQTLLSFGLFNSVVDSPLGGWNSLALFFGLVILLLLIALEQLPLTKPGRIFFAIIILFSLLMLVVINFFAIWVVLALVGMVVLMYGLVKERFSEQSLAREKASSFSGLSIALSGLVGVISIVALLGGTSFGTMVSSVSNVSFLEVRPSLGATLDITRQVYTENALLGIGPNKFADAWRLYKDPSINSSIFWSVDFQSGYSYLTTAFVTQGLLGGVLWVAWLLGFVYVGLRVLLRPKVHDTIWYFIGTSSFAAGLYLWGMSLIYTPSVAIMLLAAFFTSVLCGAHTALRGASPITFSLIQNKRAAIVLVGVVLVIIVSSVALLYSVTRHFAGTIIFSDAVADVGRSVPLDQVEAQIERAYQLSQNDLYARQVAEYQFAKISSLLTVAEPSEVEQTAFNQAVAQGVSAVRLAIQGDPSDARNHALAGALYSVLIDPNFKDPEERAKEAYSSAEALDPSNPLYKLLRAQLAVRIGDETGARAAIAEAISLKPNYTEALVLLADLEIATGNVASAITTTQAILSLEQNNPARYFQLGVLYVANEELQEATRAFEQAVVLDANYANARFFLARLYAQEGKADAALKELQVVESLNPGNADVLALKAQIEQGNVTGFTTSSSTPVLPEEGVGSDDGTPGTTVDTELVTPVNVPSESTEEEPASNEEADTTPAE